MIVKCFVNSFFVIHPVITIFFNSRLLSRHDLEEALEEYKTVLKNAIENERYLNEIKSLEICHFFL